ncbi:MAG: hypothetical protein FJ293_09665 [Planctomycetes bacterium]|nr:hypothetical protein [Planctomycetota bacterium]
MAPRPDAPTEVPEADRARWRGRRLALTVIATFLGLQTLAGLKLLAPPKRMPALQPLRVAANPTLWPFLAYDMYTRAWSTGREISRPELVGIDADGGRHALTPAALGLPFREYRDEWMNPLRGGAEAKAAPLARRFERQGGVPLVELRCEDVPAIVADDGVRDGPRRVGRRYAVGEPLR